MRIFVCLKQVPDTETRIQIKTDRSGIEETGVKWVMNPYDEYAVEEALKIRDAKTGQVTVVSVGPKSRVTDALRTAMAMGADDGIVIDTGSEILDTFATAKALSEAIKKEGAFDLVLTGKLAIDDNAASVPQIVAEFLNVPHVTVVSKLNVEGSLTAEREIEGGAREIFEVTGPAVIAANKGLNTPRYASLPGIMKAKKKPLKEISLGDLGMPKSKTRLKDFQLPPEKPAVKMLAGDAAAQAKELVRLLMEEAKVL